MKRSIRYLTVPLHVWCHADLSVFEKVVLIELDSYSDGNGCACGVQTISSAIGLPVKTIKETLKSLQSKGAIEVRIDGDGQKRVLPLLWKERYLENSNTIVMGDKPTDIAPLPYEEIAEKWAESCPHLPPIIRWSPQSKNKLRSVMKNVGLNLEQLYKCFKIVGTTQFLNGTGDFKATFRWLTSKSDNLQKVYEGFYSRSYAEKSSYEAIMHGGDANQQSETDDYYR